MITKEDLSRISGEDPVKYLAVLPFSLMILSAEKTHDDVAINLGLAYSEEFGSRPIPKNSSTFRAGKVMNVNGTLERAGKSNAFPDSQLSATEIETLIVQGTISFI